MKLKQIIFLIIGCLSLALGCVGIVLPILPTVPFFLLTVFCFANSSQKLHDWFIGTQMYKKHLESFVQKKGMTARTKATISSASSTTRTPSASLRARAAAASASVLSAAARLSSLLLAALSSERRAAADR